MRRGHLRRTGCCFILLQNSDWIFLWRLWRVHRPCNGAADYFCLPKGCRLRNRRRLYFRHTKVFSCRRNGRKSGIPISRLLSRLCNGWYCRSKKCTNQPRAKGGLCITLGVLWTIFSAFCKRRNGLCRVYAGGFHGAYHDIAFCLFRFVQRELHAAKHHHRHLRLPAFDSAT